MFRRLVLVVVALLVAGLATAAPAFAAAPTITSVTPTSGPVNTLISIVGTGFTPTSSVTVGGVAAGSVTVPTTRKITARVPAGTGGVVAVTTADGTATGPSFTVTAGITLSPAVVRPSVSATLTGSGFGANEVVDVYLDTSAVALVIANGSGAVSATVATTRTTTAGSHWVTAVGRRTGTAAQATLTVRTDWASPSFDAGHTGLNPYEAALTTSTVDDVVERWTTYYGMPVNGQPVVAGGLVVFHTYFDDVVAVDATTGAQVWRVDLSTGTTGFGAVVVAGGVVYVGASDGYLYALTLTTGAQKWRYNTGGAVADNPAVSGGTVYVPSRGGAFYALDATTGAVRWGTSFGSGVVPYSPTVAGGFVYVGTSDNQVRRLDAAGGGSGWVVSTGTGNSTPYAAPLVANGKVFVPTLGGTVLALRAATGSTDWSATVGSGSVTGTPALVGDRLIVSNGQPVVTAFDYTSGAVLWSQSGANAGYSAVSAAGGVAYVSTSTRTFAYDARTGTILRRLSLGANSGGVAISDGAVFGYDYTESQIARWDTAPRAAAARPAPASLSAAG
jgi:eukaryotic-like serine/threonine-protein kinase